MGIDTRGDEHLTAGWRTSLLATLCWAVAAPALSAELARADQRATLSVEYVYQSKGASQTPGDARRWDRRRVTRLTADLVALPSGPLPSLHAMGSAQTADLARREAVGEKLAADTAPAAALGMEAMEQAIERCGDNENCVAKAMMQSGVLSDPRLQKTAAAAQAAGRDLAPMAPRYQVWVAKAQSGRYEVAETEHHDFLDQQCPELRCSADTVVRGQGVAPPPGQAGMPTAGNASVEVDATASTMIMILPAPLAPLPVTRVVSSNLAAGKPRSPVGTFAEERPIADGLNPEKLKIMVPIKGSWRQQSGEAVIASQPGGQLIARWQLVAK